MVEYRGMYSVQQRYGVLFFWTPEGDHRALGMADDRITQLQRQGVYVSLDRLLRSSGSSDVEINIATLRARSH